jgi:hypothetical protein
MEITHPGAVIRMISRFCGHQLVQIRMISQSMGQLNSAIKFELTLPSTSFSLRTGTQIQKNNIFAKILLSTTKKMGHVLRWVARPQICNEKKKWATCYDGWPVHKYAMYKKKNTRPTLKLPDFTTFLALTKIFVG